MDGKLAQAEKLDLSSVEILFLVDLNVSASFFVFKRSWLLQQLDKLIGFVHPRFDTEWIRLLLGEIQFVLAKNWNLFAIFKPLSLNHEISAAKNLLLVERDKKFSLHRFST